MSQHRSRLLPVKTALLGRAAPVRLSLSALTLLSTSLLTLLSLKVSEGAGLELPESGSEASQRGGAAVSGVNDPTAGFLNPGALSRLKGLQLTYNHNLIWSDVSFERADSAFPSTSEGDVGRGRSENLTPFFGLNGLLALSYQAPQSRLTLGASVYGPNAGGRSSYDVSGSTRYMMTSFDGLLAFAGVSVAYGGDTWGVGVTPQLATMPTFTYRMVVDGATSPPLNPYESDLDVEAEVSVSDNSAFTMIMGGWYRPTPRLELAVSGRLFPVTFDAEGDVKVFNTPTTGFSDEQLTIDNSAARLTFSLPRTARVGVRYRQPDDSLSAGERFDLELAVVYEGWSVINDFNVELDGLVNIFQTELNDVVIEKQWRDTLSARLGGSYHLSDALSLSAGGFYEQGAAPAEYASVDLPSFDRVGLSGGLSYAVALSKDSARPRRLKLLLGYLHVFESSSTISERYAKLMQQRPVITCPNELACGANEAGEPYLGVPANAGTIRAAFQALNLGLKLEL